MIINVVIVSGGTLRKQKSRLNPSATDTRK